MYLYGRRASVNSTYKYIWRIVVTDAPVVTSSFFRFWFRFWFR